EEVAEAGTPHQRCRTVHPAIHYPPQDVERELRVTDIRHVARPKQQSLRVVKTSRLHLPGSSNACLLVTLKCCELGLEIPMLGALRFVRSEVTGCLERLGLAPQHPEARKPEPLERL